MLSHSTCGTQRAWVLGDVASPTCVLIGSLSVYSTYHELMEIPEFSARLLFSVDSPGPVWGFVGVWLGFPQGRGLPTVHRAQPWAPLVQFALARAQGAGHAQAPGGAARTRACLSSPGQMVMKVTVTIQHDICRPQGEVDLASPGRPCGEVGRPPPSWGEVRRVFCTQDSALLPVSGAFGDGGGVQGKMTEP